MSSIGRHLKAFSKDGKITQEIDLGDESSYPRLLYPVIDRDALISISLGNKGIAAELTLADIAKNTVKTVSIIKTLPNQGISFATYKDDLFVGSGMDLLIYDLGSFKLRRYIKDFIPDGFSDNGHGVNLNRINRLIVDRDHLIALTFDGQKSRVTELKEFR